MNALQPSPGAIENHEAWLPVLELSAQEVFDIMLGSRLVVAPEPATDDGLEITAMVGLAGVLCGIVTIRCSSRSGAKMASKMLGVDAEEAAPEIWDALGEIGNMVAGNFKNKIAGLGDGCMLSPPSVVTGDDYTVRSQPQSPRIEVRLLFESMPIIIFLNIHG